MKSLRVGLMFWVPIALWACGANPGMGQIDASKPRLDGAEGAAAVAYQASQLVFDPSGRDLALSDGGMGDGETTLTCEGGGSVTRSFHREASRDAGTFEASKAFHLKLDHCSRDGKTFLDGQLDGTVALTFSRQDRHGFDLHYALTLKGGITVSGEISDVVTLDVQETIDHVDGKTTFTLTGSISDSSGTHTFDRTTFRPAGVWVFPHRRR
jgi:hypothetical protein